MAAALIPSTKTELEHCGWERWTVSTGSTGKAEYSTVTRKTRAFRAARFDAFWKMDSAGFGSARRKVYHASIFRRKPLETTTSPTACRAMSSVRVAIKPQTERCSLAAAMG